MSGMCFAYWSDSDKIIFVQGQHLYQFGAGGSFGGLYLGSLMA